MMEGDVLETPEAAAFLKTTPNALRKQWREGKVPGSKVGKKILYWKPDLIEYIRGNYTNSAKLAQSDKVKRSKTCHSMNVMAFTGSRSRTKDDEYSNLLGLGTK